MIATTPPLPPTDWFRGDTYHPALIGWYEVQNSENVSWRKRHKLSGRWRFWNGANWFTDIDTDRISIFGTHPTHQWRGRRPWVLVQHTETIVPIYLEYARPRDSGFTITTRDARKFPTEVDAKRFAGRFKELGLKAVLG